MRRFRTPNGDVLVEGAAESPDGILREEGRPLDDDLAYDPD